LNIPAIKFVVSAERNREFTETDLSGCEPPYGPFLHIEPLFIFFNFNFQKEIAGNLSAHLAEDQEEWK